MSRRFQEEVEKAQIALFNTLFYNKITLLEACSPNSLLVRILS